MASEKNLQRFMGTKSQVLWDSLGSWTSGKGHEQLKGTMRSDLRMSGQIAVARLPVLGRFRVWGWETFLSNKQMSGNSNNYLLFIRFGKCQAPCKLHFIIIILMLHTFLSRIFMSPVLHPPIPSCLPAEPLALTNLFHCFCSSAFSKTSYSWNQTLGSLFIPASPAVHYAFPHVFS